MSKWWVQIRGTEIPTRVTCKGGADTDNLIRAAKADIMCLKADRRHIIVSTDRDGRNRLSPDRALSTLEEGHSVKDPLWLGPLEGI